MPVESEAAQRRRSRRRLAPFWVPLLLGFMSLASALSRPRMADVRGSDIVQLIATGMCFGVALATLVRFLRDRRAS
jgi:uncharacterized membrane-anchored protein